MTNHTQFILATSNKDKVEEISLILDEVDLIARPENLPETIEDCDTLEENAWKKAREIVQATNMAAIADDTGLFVEALDGAPGVRSARFAGENATYAENVQKLIAELDGVPDERRQAHFKTCAVAVFPDGTELLAEGIVRGRITKEPVGEYGFGYDPIFEPEERVGRTFAEMAIAEKNGFSHRGRAFEALRELIRNR